MAITHFTPAPWIVNAPHDREGSVTTISKASGPQASTPIADVINTHKQDGKANLRLIALAPEFYTVLDAFLSDIDEYGEVGFTLRQRARALLNKANGSAP